MALLLQAPTSAAVPPSAQQPQIILLKEGTDTSQGKPQLISNINACYAVADVVRCAGGVARVMTAPGCGKANAVVACGHGCMWP